MDGATPYHTPPGKDPCSSDTFTTPPPPPRRTPRATKTDHPESNVLSVTLLGDTNDDGSVDIVDFLNVLAAWGPCPGLPDPCPADFDNSGTVDIVDFLTVLANWS